MSHAALQSGIIFAKFELGQAVSLLTYLLNKFNVNDIEILRRYFRKA